MKNFVMKKKIFVLMLVMILVITGLSAQTYKRINYFDAPFYGMYDGKIIVEYIHAIDGSYVINVKENIDTKTEKILSRYFEKFCTWQYQSGSTITKWDATPDDLYRFMKKEGKNFYVVNFH